MKHGFWLGPMPGKSQVLLQERKKNLSRPERKPQIGQGHEMHEELLFYAFYFNAQVMKLYSKSDYSVCQAVDDYCDRYSVDKEIFSNLLALR